MGLKINKEKVTPEAAKALLALCPFGALDYDNGILSVNAGCKGCRLCVKRGPEGVMVWEDEKKASPAFNRDEWRGLAVLGQMRGDGIHPVTLELIGKARELAAVTGQPVYAVLIGNGLDDVSHELLHYGVDRVYLYDAPALGDLLMSPHAAALYDFICKVKPGSVLVGATSWGRSLAPRVAARCGTGLTADCTVLKMKENSDLVQIRPAFGGNIMAQIVTPSARPQFCTVRYKVFSAPVRANEENGEIVRMAVTPEMLVGGARVIGTREKPRESDISDADVIVAVGRGFSRDEDIAAASELATLLGGHLAGTRPLVEAGKITPKMQIGLSGRTVKPKLIITLGVSGSVQFAAGMKGSDFIVAVNTDNAAPIFDVAHVGIVGDAGAIVPLLIENIKRGGKAGGSDDE